MKYLSSQFGFLFSEGETRTNLTALLKYFVFLLVMVTVYAALFHLIMIRFEGQQHSWITGFYWTLVVMTTLGLLRDGRRWKCDVGPRPAPCGRCDSGAALPAFGLRASRLHSARCRDSESGRTVSSRPCSLEAAVPVVGEKHAVVLHHVGTARARDVQG